MKTGGTAISRWMKDTMRSDYIYNHLQEIEKFGLIKKHIISIRDPISRHISKMNWGIQVGYENWTDELANNDQYNFLVRNIPLMNSYEFIRQEFLQEDFNKAFETDDILSLANVSKVKEYSWDKMSEEEKDQLRQRYEPEYSMLKSLGIEYNIP